MGNEPPRGDRAPGAGRGGSAQTAGALRLTRFRAGRSVTRAGAVIPALPSVRLAAVRGLAASVVRRAGRP